MILAIYKLLCAFVAVLLVWNLLDTNDTGERIVYAFVVVPFVLRALGIR